MKFETKSPKRAPLRVCAASIFFVFAGLSCARAQGVVQPYTGVDAASPSLHYSLSANGTPVFVQKYGSVSFVRMAFSGSVEIRVSVSETVTNYQLSPKSLGLKASVSANIIAFTLSTPGKLVMRKVNSIPEDLFILADPLETDAPKLSDPGVVNLVSQGVDNTGKVDAAIPMQRAIDALAGASGGTLFVPAGRYRMDTGITLKSHVTLYLAPGSILQVPTDVRCCFKNQAVISISDAVGARLTGRGIVYGNGTNVTLSSSYFHMIYTENVDGCSIDGIVILDPGITAIRLVDTRNSTVRGVKILAANPRYVSDGIDFDSSQYIVVDDVFIYSSDDNTSQGGGTGVRKTVKDQYDLLIQNSVFYHSRTGAAFKIGTTDPQAYIGKITYRNIDIVSCIQVAAFYPTQGATIDSILLDSIRVEEVVDRPLEFLVVIPNWEVWNGRLGSIHNITLHNVSLDTPGKRKSLFLGYSPVHNVDGIRFDNFRVAGTIVSTIASGLIDISGAVSTLLFGAVN